MKFRARWTWPWGPPFVVRLRVLFFVFFFTAERFADTPFRIASHRIAPPKDHSRIGHLTQCVVTHTHTLLLCFPRFF